MGFIGGISDLREECQKWAFLPPIAETDGMPLMSPHLCTWGHTRAHCQVPAAALPGLWLPVITGAHFAACGIN